MNVRTLRKIHRYLGLFVGVQLLLWTAGGLFFSLNSIEKVRGEIEASEPPFLQLTSPPAVPPAYEPTGVARARPRGAHRDATRNRGSFRDPPTSPRRWDL